MGQEVAYGQAFLVRLSELRPVSGDRRVQIEQSGLDEAQRADRADRLTNRIEVNDRIALPRSRPRRVGVAAPEIDDGPAVDVDGQRRAHLEARDERLGERVAHGLERSVTVAVHDRASLAHRRCTTIGVAPGIRKSLFVVHVRGAPAILAAPATIGYGTSFDVSTARDRPPR